MLPDAGTPAREALEQEAHDVAMEFLREEFGNIPNALYRTYMHFREKLRDAFPEVSITEICVDARQLEALVMSDWDAAISERFSPENYPR